MSDIYHQNFVKTILNSNTTEKQIFDSIDLYFCKNLEIYIYNSLLLKIIKLKRTFIFKYMLEKCYLYSVDHNELDFSLPDYTFIHFSTAQFIYKKSCLKYQYSFQDMDETIKNDLIYIDQLMKETKYFKNNFSFNIFLKNIFYNLNHEELTIDDFNTFIKHFDNYKSLDFFIFLLTKQHKDRHSKFIYYFIEYINEQNLFGYLLKKHDEFTISFKPLFNNSHFLIYLSKYINKKNIKKLYPVYSQHIIMSMINNNGNISNCKDLLINYINIIDAKFTNYFIQDISLSMRRMQTISEDFFIVFSETKFKDFLSVPNSVFLTLNPYSAQFISLLFHHLLNNEYALNKITKNINNIDPNLQNLYTLKHF